MVPYNAVKTKFTLEDTMEAQRRSRNMSILSLTSVLDCGG
jgi:hypothetical protein